MKKIGFIAQVLTLVTALPLLSILELNHVNEKTVVKNSGAYIVAPAEKESISFNTPGNGKLPGDDYKVAGLKKAS